MISIIKCIYDSYSSCARRMDKQRLQPPTDLYQLFLNASKHPGGYNNQPKLEIFSYAYGRQEIFDDINEFIQRGLPEFNPEIGANEYASYYIRTHMNSKCKAQIDIYLLKDETADYTIFIKPTFIPSFLLKKYHDCAIDNTVDSVQLTSFLISLNLTTFFEKAYTLPNKVITGA